MLDWAAVTRIALPYSAEELTAFLLALIRENGLRQDLHIRISAFVGEDDGGLDSTGPCGVMMAAMPMGRYDRSRPMRALHVGVSAWRRIADELMPPRVKSVANYQNSRLRFAGCAGGRVPGCDPARSAWEGDGGAGLQRVRGPPRPGP